MRCWNCFNLARERGWRGVLSEAFRRVFVYPLQRFLFSMADPRRDLAFDLRKRSGPLIDHLLFMIYFRDNPAYSHWRGEAFGFIPHRLPVFKGTHKFPKQDFLDQALFLWIIDSDAVPKHFEYDVKRKGLALPADFGEFFYQAVAKIGVILHEVTGVLVREHEIEFDQFLDILEKHGL